MANDNYRIGNGRQRPRIRDIDPTRPYDYSPLPPANAGEKPRNQNSPGYNSKFPENLVFDEPRSEELEGLFYYEPKFKFDD